MLNEGASGTRNGYNSSASNNYSSPQQKEEDDPVKTLRKQMLFMDSLEKSKDPEYQAQVKAKEKLKHDKS